MNILITCGPSFEPVDRVRRITNFSTGELGVILSETFADAGHAVTCLKGQAATARDPHTPTRVCTFTTNDDLELQLRTIAAADRIDAVFHAAALCDFKVIGVTDPAGSRLDGFKISSSTPGLNILLGPATKVIATLRGLFPQARIVGWKYELDGSRPDAIERARQQILRNNTDASIANGDAYGPGFGFCTREGLAHHLDTKQTLATHLVQWLRFPPG